MNNPFHSQGPELDKHSEGPEIDKDSQLKDYLQQLNNKYGNSIPAKIWKAILLSLKKVELSNNTEQNRKIYLKA